MDPLSTTFTIFAGMLPAGRSEVSSDTSKYTDAIVAPMISAPDRNAAVARLHRDLTSAAVKVTPVRGNAASRPLKIAAIGRMASARARPLR
jgi:hypothetical protein